MITGMAGIDICGAWNQQQAGSHWCARISSARLYNTRIMILPGAGCIQTTFWFFVKLEV